MPLALIHFRRHVPKVVPRRRGLDGAVGDYPVVEFVCVQSGASNVGGIEGRRTRTYKLLTK